MTKEQKARMKEIEVELDNGDFSNFNEWAYLDTLEQEEYHNKEYPTINEFFNTHIKGKRLEDIDDVLWDYYSDWHKDVFGFRPRQTNVIGV